MKAQTGTKGSEEVGGWDEDAGSQHDEPSCPLTRVVSNQKMAGFIWPKPY